MSSIAKNIAQIKQNIDQVVANNQRPADCVKLVAVSKTQPTHLITEAYEAGCRDFGENYCQEALEKMNALSHLNDIIWHFIGPIQSNKTRDIAHSFHWVHSVDRLKIAQRLSDQRPKELPDLNICLQVNITQEATKSGMHIDELPGLAKQIITLPKLKLRGLMAIPKPSHGFSEQRLPFKALQMAFEELKLIVPTLDTLSMGMSNDLTAAIAEGSTLVRVGTAIFGPRNAKKRCNKP